MLCKFQCTKDVYVMDTKSRNMKPVTHNVYICPNVNCKDKEIIFQKNAGCTNLFNHLKTCIANGDYEELIKIYDMNCEKSFMSSLPSQYFKPQLSVTPLDVALYENIDMVVRKNFPFSYVQDDLIRHFSRHDIEIGKGTFKQTLFKLGE